jgi:hypothetical protein
MISGIYYAHSGWRYVVLAVMALAIIKALVGWLSQGRWSTLDEWLGRLTPITLDIQFLLGLVLWVMQQRWTGIDPRASWEHPLTMLIVVAIAHVTWSRTRAAPTDAEKYRTMTIGYLIAGLLLAFGVARITYVL